LGQSLREALFNITFQIISVQGLRRRYMDLGPVSVALFFFTPDRAAARVDGLFDQDLPIISCCSRQIAPSSSATPLAPRHLLPALMMAALFQVAMS